MTEPATENLVQRTAHAIQSRCAFQVATLMFMLIVTGCREAPTTVSGSVTLDGRPLVIQDSMRGTVVFQPTERGPVLNGIIDRQGDYELAAGSKLSVAPGLYTVAVSAVKIIQPTDGNPEPSSQRITPEKFASAANSGLRVEVAPGPNDIDLSLKSEITPRYTAGETSESMRKETGGQDSAHADEATE